MKLSKWAKNVGITYRTAWTWHKEGKIKNAYTTETGSIFVKDDVKIDDIQLNVIYCRVSNHHRKKELEFQVERCNQFCSSKGLVVNKIYKEVASGMNENRKEFWRMLDSNPTTIIVENKDRLSRFGFLYLNNLLLKQKCKVIVINESTEDKDDLMKDLVSIIYSFCARLYGMRRAKNKTDKIKQTIQSGD